MSDTKQHAPESAARQQGDAFLFDDFFATEQSRTVTIPVVIMGKRVPITLRPLSAEDRLAAQRAAVKKLVKPDGSVTILGMDEGAAAEEMVVRAIADWPFTFKGGEKVPVTREHVRALLGGIDAIAVAVKRMDEEGLDALVPFDAPSAEA